MRSMGLMLVCFSLLMAADPLRIWRRDVAKHPAREWPESLRETLSASAEFGAVGVIILIAGLIEIPV